MLNRLVLILCIVCANSAFAQQRVNDLYEPQVFNGMPVRVMKPFGYDASQNYPVIVSLHGAGGKGVNNQKQLKDWNRQLAETKRRKDFPCYVVAPQAAELWDANDLKNVKALIATLPAVDTDRIYVLGHSMGGHGTYIFIQLDPNFFAAAAPSAGSGLKRTEDFIDPEKIKNVPIWAFHGDQDKVCPIEKDQQVFDEMNRIGGNMKFTIWKGDNHGVSGKMIIGADNGTTLLSSKHCDAEPDFMTWLFSQTKNRPNLSGNRSSTWKRHVVVPEATSMINSAVACDYGEDGDIDLVSSYDGRVVLLKGPNWKPHTIHVFDSDYSRNPPRTSCIHSCLMDVDEDGDLDFCGSNNTVFWLECPDDPFSGEPWKYRTIDDEILGTHCLITSDVNRDGHVDLIANSGRPPEKTSIPFSLTWLEVPENPHSEKSWIRHVFADRDAPGGSHYTGVGDINGDGRPDISCAAKGGNGFPDGQWFAWWEQPTEAAQRWEKHVLSTDQPGATNIHPVHVNQDKHIDFVATRGHGRGVLWFRGPEFTPIEIDPDINGPHCLATVDLDGDGDIDIATCGRDEDGVAVWYENIGSGRFSRHFIDQDQGAYDIRTIDMDGDSDFDLLIAGHTSRNIVWYENQTKDK
ncbi:dienelactone hydrolase family protein [Planctomicrobium sp.]|nr:FG-GAP-like repeat-containing protein [Planctomicrobium sp.]MDA7527573.1 dienelactone hydrolase family protein [bacterium]MDB4733260.1 dienelactone hydrolase family protein [Planctomicrobium sp.]